MIKQFNKLLALEEFKDQKQLELQPTSKTTQLEKSNPVQIF